MVSNFFCLEGEVIRLLAFSFLSVIICDKTQSEQKSNSYTCMTSLYYTGIDLLADSPQQNIDWKMTFLQVHVFFFLLSSLQP